MPILVCLFLIFLSNPVLAVDCSPADITLSTQEEVNDFQPNHGPGCDTIVSSLTITGITINDLTPLSGLTTAGWNSKFMINGTALTSLAGLDNLSSVHWIEFNNNTSLTDVSALSSLVSVAGPLFINGNTALADLNGLNGLTSLPGGALYISNNTNLSDLSGVSNITSINASLVVQNNDALVNLDAFAGLSSVSANIIVSQNEALTDMSGLGNMVGFEATLYIRQNSHLVNLGNLLNLTDLGGLVISANNMLANLDGLDNLTTLGNQTALAIYSNNSLADIDALSSVVSAEWEVELRNNPLLTQCAALATLLDSVDDALPGPGPNAQGIPDVGGDVTVADNGAGCNSISEILGELPPGADLTLDVQPEFADINAGDTVEFDFVVFNKGPDPASNVTVTADFSGAVVPEAIPPECGFDAGNTRLVCIVPALPASSGEALSPLMRFPDGGDQTLDITVTADQADAHPDDNSASVPIFVSGIGGSNIAAGASLLSGDNALGQVLTGTEITIGAAAANSGPNPATGVTVEVTLPADWTPTTYDPGCSVDAQPEAVTLTCPLPDLPAPALPSIPTDALTQIQAIAGALGNVTVVASANESDPAPDNNQAELPVDVRAFSADLRVEESSRSHDNYLLDDSSFFINIRGNVSGAEDQVQPSVILQLSPADQVTAAEVLHFDGNCVDESTDSVLRWRCDADYSSRYWVDSMRMDFEVNQPGDYVISARIDDNAAFDIDPVNNYFETTLTVLPPPPVRVRAMEVNQVVQNWLNQVYLYSGKQTVVRIFLEDDLNLRTETTGRLVGLRGGIPVAGSPLAPVNNPIRPDSDALNNRPFRSRSINFILPDNWTEEGNLELVFDLQAKGRPVECAEPGGTPDCRVNIGFIEPVVPELDVLGAGYTTDEVQWLVFDCGDSCWEDPENEGDPPVIVPSGTIILDVGAQPTDPIDVADLMEDKSNALSAPLEKALTDLPQFDACREKELFGGGTLQECDIVVRRLRDRFLEDGQIGWRISIRKQVDWGTFFVDQTNLKDATATISEKQRGGMYQAPPTLADLFEQVARLKTTLPLASIDTRYLWIADFNFKPTTHRDINPVLNAYRLVQDSQCATCRTDAMRVGGYLLQGGVEGSGGNAMNRVYSSYIGNSPGMTHFGYPRNTGPHEFAHSFGKEHAVVQLNEDGDGTIGLCNAVASEQALVHPWPQEIPGLTNKKLVLDSDYSAETWPTLGPLDQGPDAEIWGFDTRFTTGGTTSPVVNPYKAVDMMSYCFTGNGKRKWPSDYTYLQVEDGLRRGAVGTPDDKGEVGDIVYIAGSIDEYDAVEIALVAGATAPKPDQEEGELKISFVDDVGNPLSEVFVPLQAADGQGDLSDNDAHEGPVPAGFAAALAAPGPTVAALVIGDPSDPLARFEASENAPTVEIIAPTSATILPEEGLTIEWTAIDADGDKLRSSVFYSADLGENWSILGLGISGNSILVPAEQLAMSDMALIKVSVSDGIHFAEAVSEPFLVLNSEPMVAIVSVPVDERLVPDNLVHRFESAAWDTEDGNLADDSAVWTSSLDGTLGSGSPLDVILNELSPGCHTISAEYTDSEGATGIATQRACVRELILSDGFE